MRCNVKGYCSIGFGSEMDNTDMIACITYDGVTATMIDTYGNGHDVPDNDTALGGFNDLIMVSNAVTANTIECEFDRKLNTGDKYDGVIEVDNEQSIIWAWYDTRAYVDH
eukprot:CAMPEP_0168313798 /NCGR_PEP_ID=MMETSP0210-20121227/4512_1 /TAXON_ID=40633 /ORGANISM="Condylostoma magnum, Strain COL2" /LENGTH=109 /DNA_ID=CAMNT_0008275137 /DNA_START=14 /DNA_END=343 /DNA_ORIENTATION=+